MGNVDNFLYHHAAGGLHPGEQVLGYMHARHPFRFNGFGVPVTYSEWLAVATSSRLLMFRTDVDILSAPKAEGLETMIWNYDEIAAVELGSVSGISTGIFFRLHPHSLCGPTKGEAFRLDLYASASGLDDHGRTRAFFPQWLKQQVESGAFPMTPEKRAEVDARVAANIEGSRARATADAQRHDQFVKMAMPLVLRAVAALTIFCAIAILGAVARKSFGKYGDLGAPHEDHVIRNARESLESVKNKRRPSDECAYQPEECSHCSQSRTLYPGYQAVEDHSGFTWYCPAASYYEARLKSAIESRSAKQAEAEAEQKRERTWALVRVVGCTTGVLVLIAGAVGFGVWDVKRMKRAKRLT